MKTKASKTATAKKPQVKMKDLKPKRNALGGAGKGYTSGGLNVCMADGSVR